jgi:hypothetical protein
MGTNLYRKLGRWWGMGTNLYHGPILGGVCYHCGAILVRSFPKGQGGGRTAAYSCSSSGLGAPGTILVPSFPFAAFTTA